MDGLKQHVLLGVALGMAEAVFLPAAWPLRLGWANMATLLAAVQGWRPAVAVALVRALVVAASTGTLLAPSGLFSLAGGMASALVMASALRLPLSLIVASSAGGLASSLVQVLVFGAVSGVGLEDIRPLAPWFAAWGVVSGAVNGVLVSVVLRRVSRRAGRGEPRSCFEAATAR